MHLYLVRHGDYVSPIKNTLKPLSNYGKSQISILADALKIKDIHVGEIRHSQKLRAKETAEILAQAIKSKRGAQEVRGLNPMDDISNMITELENTQEDLMLVGHNPFMEKLAYALTGESVAFGIAALVEISNISGQWRVKNTS
jgi:phosphohistidine phosphatase